METFAHLGYDGGFRRNEAVCGRFAFEVEFPRLYDVRPRLCMSGKPESGSEQ
jgi:hypothetical protein